MQFHGNKRQGKMTAQQLHPAHPYRPGRAHMGLQLGNGPRHDPIKARPIYPPHAGLASPCRQDAIHQAKEGPGFSH